MLMYYKESFMIYSIQKVFSDFKIVTPKSLGLFWEAMIITHLKSHKKIYKWVWQKTQPKKEEKGGKTINES